MREFNKTRIKKKDFQVYLSIFQIDQIFLDILLIKQRRRYLSRSHGKTN